MITVIYNDGEKYTYSSVEEAEKEILNTRNGENVDVQKVYNTYNSRPYRIASQISFVKLVMDM